MHPHLDHSRLENVHQLHLKKYLHQQHLRQDHPWKMHPHLDHSRLENVHQLHLKKYLHQQHLRQDHPWKMHPHLDHSRLDHVHRHQLHLKKYLHQQHLRQVHPWKKHHHSLKLIINIIIQMRRFFPFPCSITNRTVDQANTRINWSVIHISLGNCVTLTILLRLTVIIQIICPTIHSICHSICPSTYLTQRSITTRVINARRALWYRTYHNILFNHLCFKFPCHPRAQIHA